MKRCDIEFLTDRARTCFEAHGWALPPHPVWDVTDFGLGNWRRHGLVLVNLAEEPEYCEKLMYAQRGMTTPAHCHRLKKEDIICRWGRMSIQVWQGRPEESGASVTVKLNRSEVFLDSGAVLELGAGERVTLVPGVYHAFVPLSDECIIGEVSTANDDLHDNYFANPDVGRFPTDEA